MSIDDELSEDWDEGHFSADGIPIEFLPEKGKLIVVGFDHLQSTGFFIAGEDYESLQEARAVMHARVRQSREDSERIEYSIVNYRGFSLETTKSYEE